MHSAPQHPSKRTRAIQRGRAGFVLLEIVMALGLFSMVAVSLTLALDQIAKTSKLARDESRVMRVLESVLAEVVHAPELKEITRTFESSADGVEATAEVRKIRLFTKNKAELDKMFAIRVTAWISDGRDRILERSMETYVYSPNSKA
jgi:type II secretory pathway pseudopilin PulG